MVCLVLTFFLAFVPFLQACSEPLNVHIQNYEAPIILHTANCDNQQLPNLGNQCLGACDNRCFGTYGNQQLGTYSNQQLGTYGNQQLGYYGNQYIQPVCYETECTCVSKQNYSPCVYGGSVATYGGSGCCPVADPKPMVYCVCNSYGNSGYSNNYGGNQGYQGYPACQGKYSVC